MASTFLSFLFFSIKWGQQASLTLSLRISVRAKGHWMERKFLKSENAMHIEPGYLCYLRSLKPTGSFSHLEKRATLCAAGNHGDYTHVNPAHIKLENKCYQTLNLSEEISPFVYKATLES